jgi:hypothetical protein
MPSSALSKRRGPLRRPKVCKSSPNPGRCHPPQPPLEWPPVAFDMHVMAVIEMEPMPESFDESVHLEWNEMMELWMGNTPFGAGNVDAQFSINAVTEKGNLTISGELWAQFYQFNKSGLGLVWGVETAYSVSAWTFVDPPGSSCTAEFTF